MPAQLNGDPSGDLDGTPYLVGDGGAARDRFMVVRDRAASTRARALAAAASIAKQAHGLLLQFDVALRSDLVAESNRMEGIESSPRSVRDLVQLKRELLEMETSGLIAYIRDDPRLLESLGLYRAYQIADEWALAKERPREFELRGLQALVMPTHPNAGAYKFAPNEIGGSAHTPTFPSDVAEQMRELAAWFRTGTGDESSPGTWCRSSAVISSVTAVGAQAAASSATSSSDRRERDRSDRLS